MQTGSSSVAEVISCGEGVTRYKCGDLFFHDSHHTLFVKVNEDDTIPLPEGLIPEQAVFARYCAVSWTSIFRMRAKPVDNIIVTGLGLVGLMASQVLNCIGYRVFAIDRSPARCEIAAKANAEIRVAASFDAIPAEWNLKKNAGGMLECTGNEEALRSAIPYMRANSDIFQVGVPWHKNGDWDAHSLLYDLFYSYVSLHGGWEWYLPKKGTDFEKHSSYYHVQSAMELIKTGKIKVIPEMYRLKNPRDADSVYKEIAFGKTQNPTAFMFDWRKL
jgi:threonine dehydrogenase-like Zn-dependent dehydrogenase